MGVEKNNIKYYFENAAASLVVLISAGFILSLIYNFSYFNKLGKTEFLTLLDFSDYVESSIIFIGSVLLILFYSQIINIDSDGIVGKLQSWWNAQKKAKNQLQSCSNPIIKGFRKFFLTIFNVLVLLIQLIGVTFPYLMVMIFAYSAYLNSLAHEFLDEDSFLVILLVIVPGLFVLDIIIGTRPKEYKTRKIVFKILMIAAAIAYTIGAYDASKIFKKIEKDSSSETIFLRAVNKGAFSLQTEKEKVIFEPWHEIKKIGD